MAPSPKIWSLPGMQKDDDNLAESNRILRQVNRESDGAPFGGPDAPRAQDDPLDRLGTRIGRGLGLILTVSLLLAIILWFDAAKPS